MILVSSAQGTMGLIGCNGCKPYPTPPFILFMPKLSTVGSESLSESAFKADSDLFSSVAVIVIVPYTPVGDFLSTRPIELLGRTLA